MHVAAFLDRASCYIPRALDPWHAEASASATGTLPPALLTLQAGMLARQASV